MARSCLLHAWKTVILTVRAITLLYSWLPATLEGTVALFGNEPPVTWQTEVRIAVYKCVECLHEHLVV